MDQAAELRYYEILFIKTINQFFNHYKLDKLTTFVEMACFMAEADITQVTLAMQRILTNDATVRIMRDEYAVCLKLFSGLNDVKIRKLLKCSPNTLTSAFKTYEDGELCIQSKFGLRQSGEIRKMLKALRKINEIY